MPRNGLKTLTAIVLALCCGFAVGCSSDDDEPASEPASTVESPQKADKKDAGKKQAKKPGKPARKDKGATAKGGGKAPPPSEEIGWQELQVSLAEALDEELEEEVADNAPICSENDDNMATCLVPLGETTYKYKVRVDESGAWEARGTELTGAVELRESPDSPEGRPNSAPTLEGQL